MIFINHETGMSPVVIHAPGMNHRKDLEDYFWSTKKMLDAEPPRRLNTPADAKIVTWNTNDTLSPLEESLNHLGMKYTTLKHTPWTNIHKMKTLAEVDIQEPFVIGLDAFDALVLGSLDELVDWFRGTDIGMVYNGEKMFWPDLPPLRGVREFEEQKGMFLNGGVFIARTDFLKKIYLPTYLAHSWRDLYDSQEQLAADLMKRYGHGDTPDKIMTSEQLICHMIYKKLYPAVQLDYESRYFQVISYCERYFFQRNKRGPLLLRRKGLKPLGRNQSCDVLFK